MNAFTTPSPFRLSARVASRAMPWARSLIALAVASSLSPWVIAQTSPNPGPATPASSPRPTPGPTELAPIVVTGNPLASETPATPVSVLTGDELVRRRGNSIGETLNGLPGVSSTYFGPNANRPVIRGLDGDRVRILGNGGASLDASSLSFDHAVPLDPLIVDRLEVLRGPGALLYGGSAVGGVVNALDNRIPSQPVEGVSGAVEGRLGGAERERGGAALVEAGNGRMAIHVDAFGRETDDLRVPNHVPVEDGAALPETQRIRNSASHTKGAALGGSVFFDQGHAGVAVDTYDSTYGIVAEPDVVIKMKRDHLRFATEFKQPDGFVRTWRAQANYTDYRHQEVEGSGEVGTTFDSTGGEVRLEAEHAPIGAVRGVWGLHLEDTDFAALGEEAFVPSTRTKKQALFVFEELPWAAGTSSAGLRIEHVKVRSDGDADPSEPQFGEAGERSFTLRSASLSHVVTLAPQWTLTGAFSHTERAPTSFELYANGVHAATGVFERGDTTLGTERGRNLDVSVQWKDGSNHLRLGAFATRFSRFISLESTGADEVVDGEGVPLYAFRPVRARMHGLELEGRQRVLSQAVALDVTGKLDLTRGSNADTGEPLPRLAPLRANVGLDATSGPWAGRVEVDHAERQRRVPATDRSTAGYTLVNASVSRAFDWNGSRALWFVKLTNLGNELAYSATTTDSIRDLVPLAGRGIKTGVRMAF